MLITSRKVRVAASWAGSPSPGDICWADRYDTVVLCGTAVRARLTDNAWDAINKAKHVWLEVHDTPGPDTFKFTARPTRDPQPPHEYTSTNSWVCEGYRGYLMIRLRVWLTKVADGRKTVYLQCTYED